METLTIDTIPWDDILFIGSGFNCVTFVWYKYAIKVGDIYQKDIDRLKLAALHKISPPVYDFEKNVDIPQHIKDIWIERVGGEWGNFSKKEYNVAIVARAIPVETLIKSTEDSIKLNKACKRFSKKVNSEFEWYDDHIGNMGIYKGRYVVLDW